MRGRLLFVLLGLAPLAANGGTFNAHPAAPPAAPEEQMTDSATLPPQRATSEIGGRSEQEWRDAALAKQQGLKTAQEALATCEAHEAPAPYRDYAGYYRPAARPRDGYRWVEIKNCDNARADLSDAQRDLDDFEEHARQSAVPPGWLR